MAAGPVLVVDFGAQYAQLIARRVREANVYAELAPHSMPVDEMLAKDPQAIILSGGPASVFEPGAPRVDKKLFDAGVPVLGISVDRTPAYLPDGQQAARVYTVDLNGPGDKAGLEVDDLIYEADGVRVETSNDLLRVRHRHAAGEEMILKVCRGGEYLTVSVTLEAKK